MPQLLIEILQEEIPARMQQAAALQLLNRFTEALKCNDLTDIKVQSFATPLRLVLVVDGLPVHLPDQQVERKGPLVSAPKKAVAGFLRSVGVSSVNECNRVQTNRGEALLFRSTIKGKPTAQWLPEALSAVMHQFNWPKSMRMGSNDFRWVRPLQQIMLMFDGQFLSDKIHLGSDDYLLQNQTIGRKFSNDIVSGFTDFASYRSALEQRGIILDFTERKALITQRLSEIAQQNDVVWSEDQSLLNEVAGLIENVHVLDAEIDQQFMVLPDAVLRLMIRENQKYFLFCNQTTGAFAPLFAVVTPNTAPAAAAFIRVGNQRVLRARLRDAEFFLQQDQRFPLMRFAERLSGLRFADGLGSMADKCQRMARILSLPEADIDPETARHLPYLAKADLVTEMVGEFPELQGMIGGHYAATQGKNALISQAISQHYAPKGAADRVPEATLGQWLALADKLDTVAAFAHKGSLPKGSGDPFAIRRAMLGIIRILLAQDRLTLLPKLLRTALSSFDDGEEAYASAWSFYQARMIQYLKDQGIETAVAWAAMDAEPARVHDIAHAMQKFIITEQGQRLRQAFVRVMGILRQHHSEDVVDDDFNISALPVGHAAVDQVLAEVITRIENALYQRQDDAEVTFTLLSDLAKPLDEFFVAVMVNAEDNELRSFRYILLQRIRNILMRVANFERLISG